MPEFPFRYRAIVAGPFLFLLMIFTLFQTGEKVVKADTNTGNIAVGSRPYAVAVNSVTNKIYIANCGVRCFGGFGESSTLTVIDGRDNSTSTIFGENSKFVAIAVNPVTNKIYVADENVGRVLIIDGNDNSVTSVTVGQQPFAIAINSITNKIYVSNGISNITIIDGTNNSLATVSVGMQPNNIAIPFKLLLFVMLDGWSLLIHGLTLTYR